VLLLTCWQDYAMTDDQVQLLLEFLQRVGLLRRSEDVQETITLHQFPSLTGTATYQTTLLDVLPDRRPVCFSISSVVTQLILRLSTTETCTRSRDWSTVITSCFSRCLAVCLSVHASVWQHDYCKSNQPISLKLGVMIVPTTQKIWLTFGDDPVADTDCESLFHLPRSAPCGIGHFMRFISISHAVTGRFSRNSAKWLTPTRNTLWEQSGRHPNPDQAGNQDSSFGPSLVEVCSLWVLLSCLVGLSSVHIGRSLLTKAYSIKKRRRCVQGPRALHHFKPRMWLWQTHKRHSPWYQQDLIT